MILILTSRVIVTQRELQGGAKLLSCLERLSHCQYLWRDPRLIMFRLHISTFHIKPTQHYLQWEASVWILCNIEDNLSLVYCGVTVSCINQVLSPNVNNCHLWIVIHVIRIFIRLLQQETHLIDNHLWSIRFLTNDFNNLWSLCNVFNARESFTNACFMILLNFDSCLRMTLIWPNKIWLFLEFCQFNLVTPWCRFDCSSYIDKSVLLGDCSSKLYASTN